MPNPSLPPPSSSEAEYPDVSLLVDSALEPPESATTATLLALLNCAVFVLVSSATTAAPPHIAMVEDVEFLASSIASALYVASAVVPLRTLMDVPST